MNRILIAVYSETSTASEGRNVPESFDRDDALTLDGYAIITKQDDGTYVVNDVRGLQTFSELHQALNGYPGNPTCLLGSPN